MAHKKEKSTTVNSNVSPAIDQIAENIKANDITIDDLMFYELVNVAGLAPGEYQELDPEEENRHWELLFSLPESELQLGTKKAPKGASFIGIKIDIKEIILI